MSFYNFQLAYWRGLGRFGKTLAVVTYPSYITALALHYYVFPTREARR